MNAMQLIRQLCISALSICAISACSRAALAVAPPLLGTLNGPDYLVNIDRDTGVGTRIGHLGIGFDEAMTALEFDALHQVLYGATSSIVPNLYTVDPQTGAASRVGAPGILGILATGMAHDPIQDILYAAGGDRFFRKNLYTVNRTTGQSVLLGPVSGITDSIQGLAFDPVSRTLYGLDEFTPSGARIVEIDPVALTSAPVTGQISNENGWNGLAFDPFTGYLYASGNMRLYRIDPVMGSVLSSVLILSPENHTVGALTVMAPFVIPEPVSGVLIVTGAMICAVGGGRIARKSPQAGV